MPSPTACLFLCAFAPVSVSLSMYDPLELTVALPTPLPPSPDFNVSSTWIDLTAPDGSVTRHGVFYTRAYARSQADDGSEVLTAAGAPHYAARLACAALGHHAYAQRTAPGFSPPPLPLAGAFECSAPATADGWAAVDGAHGQYFVLRNISGTAARAPFWLVGENMGWPGVWPYFNGSSRFSNGTGGTYMYDRMLPKLAAVGGNYIRLWACPSLTAEPEWDGERGSFLALGLGSFVPWGTYNLEAAWRLDYIVERCRALGIKINLVLFTTQETCADGTWCFWPSATWNAANGGPLAQASDLWTSAAAAAELAQRWRYVLARWAYSTSIFSFELANENDGAAGWGDAAADLQLALASGILAADPYNHLVDNSFQSAGEGDAAVRRMEGDPRIAFTAGHAYGPGDFAAAVWADVTPRVAAHGKPAFLQEHGADWRGPLQHLDDPTGIGSHNAAWASAVGLGAGTGMQWWWNEVDALDIYWRLAGAATFVREAIGDRLLALRWFVWNNGSSMAGCAGTNAGWTVGFDGAGLARAASLFVYNRNHTWAAQNASAQLNEIAACTVTLHNLPLPAAPAVVTWFDTATGKPLVDDRHAARSGAAPAAGDLSFAAPAFTRDAAALALLESADALASSRWR